MKYIFAEIVLKHYDGLLKVQKQVSMYRYSNIVHFGTYSGCISCHNFVSVYMRDIPWKMRQIATNVIIVSAIIYIYIYHEYFSRWWRGFDRRYFMEILQNMVICIQVEHERYYIHVILLQ